MGVERVRVKEKTSEDERVNLWKKTKKIERVKKVEETTIY